METLNTLLARFQEIAISGVSNLEPYAVHTFMALIVVDFVWTYIQKIAREEGSFTALFSTLVIKCFKYGFWFYVITHYGEILNTIKNSFIMIGTVAGGGGFSAADISNPSAIISSGIEHMLPITDKLKATSLFEMSSAVLLLVVGYIIGMACYFVIAFQVFLTLTEFYLISTMLIIFIPFAVVDKTSFLAEKAISALVGFGVRMSVLSMIIGISAPLLESNNLEGTAISQIAYFCATTMALAILVWQAPAMAGGLMSGSPMLSGNGLMAGAVGVATSGASIIKDQMGGGSGGGNSGGSSGGSGDGLDGYRNSRSLANESRPLT